jgi:hypothetical protein
MALYWTRKCDYCEATLWVQPSTKRGSFNGLPPQIDTLNANYQMRKVICSVCLKVNEFSNAQLVELEQ